MTDSIKKVHKHGQWSSKFGFLMATIGSSVGLGNIWRFPYLAGEKGGAVFLVVYICMVFLIGVPLLSAELSVGRDAASGNINAYAKYNKKFSFLGVITTFVPFLILCYYSVIGAWLIRYMVGYIGGGGFLADGNYQAAFQQFISNPWLPIIFIVIFLAICSLTVIGGVQKGIEKMNKILMPALFVMLIFVAIVSLTMPNSIKGVEFFMVPNMDRVNESGGILYIIVDAMGQAFFSLSLGIGISTTYGSYLNKQVDIVKSTFTVCAADTLVAVIAGFAIFPAVFSAGLEPSSGPSLLFITLPAVFQTLGGFGIFVGVLFFALVLFAAVTSSIALGEVFVSSLSEKTKLGRTRSTLIAFSLVAVIAVVISLSQDPQLMGIDLISLLDDTVNTLLLPFSGFCICIYAVFVLKKERLLSQLSSENLYPKKINKALYFLLKFVTPLFIVVVFVFGLIKFTNTWFL